MPRRRFTTDPSTSGWSGSDPPPPPPDRRIRIAARVLLWTLIGIAVVRGVLPAPSPPARSRTVRPPLAAAGPPGGSVQDQAAAATATAFLREYLTVDDLQPERPGRLGRYLARGVEVDDGVLPERGTWQAVDLLAPAGVRRASGRIEVTVVAHLVRTRDGTAAGDGATVAFAVPLVGGAHGLAVAGVPRPVVLPIDPAVATPPATLPTALARTVAAVAGKAVAALLNGDRPSLARLGGDAAPVVRPFPNGWRPLGVTGVRPAGPPDAPTAEVLVRARPPISGIDYLVPVRVSLRSATTPTVREIDAGGTP